MSNHKVQEAKRQLSYGLRHYEGRSLEDNDEKAVIEIMENCIKDLNWDEFNEVLSEIHGPAKDTMCKARDNTKKKWQNDMAAKAGVGIDHINIKIETEEEKEKRIQKQESNFFFKKKASSYRCNCGAGFTEFPNHHASFCAETKSLFSKNTGDYVD